MTRFNLTIEIEDEVILELSAPSFDLLEEKYGAWERARLARRESVEEKDDTINF